MTAPSEDESAGRTATAPAPARVPRLGIRAGIAGLLAVLAGVGLAVAPVTVAKTEVRWPSAGEPAESTVLLLTNQTPYSLDLAFDADSLRQAEGEVLFATMQPDRDDARTLGLVLEVAEDTLTVSTAGSTEEVAVPDRGAFELHSDIAGLTLSRDGETVLEWPGVLPPQVDALITDADGAELSARLHLVDDFNSAPTPLKVGLMVLLWLALGLALFWLWQDDRAARALRRATTTVRQARPWWRRFVITDALVVVALAGWVFIGPMTDDDGYYANMALNYGDAGYVGNYYQMFNQSFTPFTWFWQLLYVWQELGGRSPVWLRVPALIAAVVAWFLTRAFFDRMLADRSVLLRRTGHLFLGLVYVAWWLPYAIGTRPEVLGALGSAIALTLVARAVERGTLLPAAFAALAAGLAFAAHPTGGVAFAPIVLAIPALWRIARRDGSVAHAVARTAAVLSVGSVALFAAFADASIRDFLVGSARFAAVETPLDWTDESARYGLLLANAPMGAYAKRAVVLVALVALLWFVVVWTVARVQRVGGPALRITLAGWSFGLALIALWVTTSKWTHHFGALSVLGPLLLATAFLLLPGVVRSILGERRLPVWLVGAVPLSFLPAIVVSLNGPNSWAYAFGQFMYSPGGAPAVGSLGLASLRIWLPVIALIAVGVVLVLRRRRKDWRGPAALFGATALVAVFFAVSTGFLYATFANAAVRGLSSFSAGGANLADPAGRACLVEDAITLWDANRGTALTERDAGPVGAVPEQRPPQAPAAELVLPETLPRGGWPASSPPPEGDRTIWANSADGVAGARETSWYALPERLAAQERVTVLVGGSADEESSSGVLMQVGRATAEGVAVTREAWVTDAAERPGWRTLVLDLTEADLGSDAVLRLVGVDGSPRAGDWFGFSEPVLVDGVPMSSAVTPGQPTLVAWQVSFWFPCERPMRIADGIIEPPEVTTTWADVSPDNIWVERRGGALAGAARIATVSSPATSMAEVGPGWGRVQFWSYPYPADGYDVVRTPVTVLGWSAPFGPASQLAGRG